jgi:hypothetical protein
MAPDNMVSDQVAEKDRTQDRAIRAAAYLLILLVAGLAACGAELVRARRATRHTATASVSVPTAWWSIGRQQPGPPVDPAAIEREITSEESLARALSRSDSADFDDPFGTGPQAKRKSNRRPGRQDLHVRVEAVESDAIRVAIRCTTPDAMAAVCTVNRLAEDFATQQRAKVAQSVASRLSGIFDAGERARRDMQEIGSQLDSIISQAATPPVPSVDPPRQPIAAQPEAGATTPFQNDGGAPPVAKRVDPQLREARDRLVELREFRQKLLLQRTGEHPEVQQIDAKIALAQEQLSAIESGLEAESRAVAEHAAVVPPAVPSPAAPPAPQVARSPSDDAILGALRTLRGRLDRAEPSVRPGATGAEAMLQIWRGEDVDIQWADRAEPISRGIRLWDLLAVALTAGVACTAGVGLVRSGARIDPPLCSPIETEHALGVPILGEIPVGADPRHGRTWRTCAAQVRWACVGIGVALVGLYVLLLVLPLTAG